MAGIKIALMNFIKKLDNNNSNFLDIIIILVLGLVPLLWFKPGYLIDGVDINFSLDTSIFLSRLYVWNPMFIGGTDRSMDSTLLLIMGLQFLLFKLGLTPIVVEKVIFVILYSASGLAMFYFISQLVRGNSGTDRVTRFASVIFYMFNFYQVYMWAGVKLGELIGAILIPALLGLYIRGLEKKISTAKVAIIVLIVSILCSGVGIQPPVIGVFFITLLLYLIFFLLYTGKWKNARNLIDGIKIFVLFALMFFLANMFWIIPVANYSIQSGYTSTSASMEVFNSLSLLEYVSRENGFMNLFRMFGDIFWFDSWGGEPYYHFFQVYQTNILLVFGSFILPILAFSTLLISKNRYVLFFSLISVLYIFIGKGVHPPFGEIYLYLFEKIPGLWIYRAPWQKFGLVISLSYAFLIGTFCGKLFQFLEQHYLAYNTGKKIFSKFIRKIPIFIILLIISINLIYMAPFIFGKMLPTWEERKVLPGYHQKYPQYIFDAEKWINTQDEEFKIILLPDDKTNVYSWGYGAPADISLRLFNKGILFRQYGEGTAPPQSVENMYRLYVNSLYNNLTPNTAKILGLLNVRYVLQRNDFLYDFYGDTDSPQFISSSLNTQTGIYLEKSFGKWDFYRVNYSKPHLYIATKALYIDNLYSLLPFLSSANFTEQFDVFFTDKNSIKNLNLSNVYFTNPNNKNLMNYTVQVSDGWKESILWEIIPNNSYLARYYVGTKGVISTNGKGDSDMLIFSSPKQTPYKFPSPNLKEWTAYNSTLVYLKSGSMQLRIDKIFTDGEYANDIVGVWWEDGWIGMNTKSISYPIIIPSNQKAIIQINHLAKNITLSSGIIENIDLSDQSRKILNNPSESIKSVPTLTFLRINPIKYKVSINASEPFLLIFSENYHPEWKAYISSDVSWLETFWKRPIDEKNHLLANGYANGWYIEKTGNFDITLYFLPQRLFYIGLIVTTVTLILGASYFIRKRKKIF